MALGRNLLAMNDEDREALLEWVKIGEGQYPETGFEELIQRCAKLHPVRNAYSLAKGIAEGWALPPDKQPTGKQDEPERRLSPRVEEPDEPVVPLTKAELLTALDGARKFMPSTVERIEQELAERFPDGGARE